MNLIFYIALGTTLFCGIGLLASMALALQARATNVRVLEVGRGIAVAGNQKKRLRGRLFSLLRGVRARIGISEDAKLRERFIAAGIRGTQAVETYFAAKMLGPVAGILVGSFIPEEHFSSGSSCS